MGTSPLLLLLPHPAAGWLVVLYWLAAPCLAGAGQGLLMPAIRRTPSGQEASTQAFALHIVLAAAYFLPLVLAPSWAALGFAALSRLVLFDACLNHFAGDQLLAVGRTAGFDKLLRRLAPTHPERLALGLKLLGLAGLLGLGWVGVK